MRPRRPARGAEGEDRDAGRGGEAAGDGPREEAGEGAARLARGLEGVGRSADGAAVGALWGRRRREGNGREEEEERRRLRGVGV